LLRLLMVLVMELMKMFASDAGGSMYISMLQMVVVMVVVMMMMTKFSKDTEYFKCTMI
jgi:hypothetical protein